VLTFRTKPLFTNLTSLVAVKEALSITGSASDTILKRMIVQASSVFRTFTGRTFVRGFVTETLSSVGELELLLDLTPVVLLEAVRYKTETVTDLSQISIQDANAGILLNRNLWNNTFTRDAATIGGDINPHQSLPDYDIDYSAGYFVPDDDIASTSISASSTDDSFNLSSGTFPLLVAGDTFVVAGFVDGANNGTFTVVTRASAKITVAEALVTEAAGPSVTLAVNNLPEDIELAIIKAVVHFHESRAADPAIKSEKIGDYARTLFDQGVGDIFGSIPSLRHWVRIG